MAGAGEGADPVARIAVTPVDLPLGEMVHDEYSDVEHGLSLPGPGIRRP